MPISRTQPAAADKVYGSPFVGPIHHTAQIAVNITALTNAEIDAKGFIKPGLPLRDDGGMVGAGDAVFGIVIEAIKVAASNSAADIAAANAAFELALATHGQVNQDIIEDNLARALTADEIAGFNLAPSTMKLL